MSSAVVSSENVGAFLLPLGEEEEEKASLSHSIANCLGLMRGAKKPHTLFSPLREGQGRDNDKINQFRGGGGRFILGTQQVLKANPLLSLCIIERRLD